MITATSILTTLLAIALAASAQAANPIGIPENYQLLFSNAWGLHSEQKTVPPFPRAATK